MAVMASIGITVPAMAATATSDNRHGIWHRYAAYDIGNVRPSPTTVSQTRVK